MTLVGALFAPVVTGVAGGETGRVLLDILIILVAAKIAAELAERVRIPTVVGEIAAGILIGPSALRLVKTGSVLDTLAELGVILLLLEVGMHMDLRELRSVGRAALSVAVVGVVLPFGAAMLVGPLLGLTGDQTLFTAAALTATSVGITARVFGDLRSLASVEARTVLGAAVADDVLGLIILTVVVRLVTGDGAVTIGSIGLIVATAAVFLVVCTVAGTMLAPRLFAWIDRHAKSSASLFALALAFALGIAQLATLAKLAPIIGAFVAGLSLGRSEPAARIQRELTPVGHLFIPVFFLQIGINVQLKAFANPKVLAIAGALTVIAIIGKVAAGWAVGSLKADRLTVGLGMIPRGEVGLIFASIGLAASVFTQDIYAAILLMVLITTLITPPLLGWRAKQLRDREEAENQAISTEPTETPVGGWLVALGEELTLAGVPGPDQLLEVALPSARSVAEGRVPSEDLVKWIVRTAPVATVTWTAKSTASLMHLLQHGTNRSWRFLETTGILEFALPELANAIQSRRSNAMELDPMGVHRWPTMDRVKALLPGTIVHPDQLLLTALLIDTCTDNIDSARAVLDRLGLNQDDRDRIGRMFVDAQLLRGTALRTDGLTEDSVLRLAVHIGDQTMADELMVLSNCTDALETWERAAINELYRLVTATLAGSAHGGATAEILERRRAEVRAIVSTQINPEIRGNALERIESAPVNYLLSNDANTAARHAILITQLKRRGQVAASVLRAGNSAGVIDIATLDVTGLLARSTGVLEALGLSIEDATIATWVDGIAVQTFTVRSLSDWIPTAEDLETELTNVIDARLQSSPVTDAILSFDNTASPWHTLCTLCATDRPGVLHAVAAAMATCGVDIHAASISTEDELVLDVFQLTDSRNAKLTIAVQEEVRQAIARGITSGRDGSLRNRRKKGPTKQTRNTTETIR
jgi:Kef-type K+ transport system membrane component KefB/predicted amino acid-binding ACT domain protein